MELFEAMRIRRSYRDEFTSEVVPRENLVKIVQAGIIAPSGLNGQTTSFIIVDDKNILKQLSDLSNLPKTATAPSAIMVLSKPEDIKGYNSFHLQDYSAATENMLLAMASMGYVTSWIEGQIEKDGINKKMAQLLGVPDDGTYVAIYMPIGVPVETTTQAEKKPFNQRAWFNHYGQNA